MIYGKTSTMADHISFRAGMWICFSFTLIFQVVIVSTISIPSTNGFSMKIIHRDHPTSPLYPGYLTQAERMKRLVKFSEERVSQFQSVSSHDDTLKFDEVGFTLKHSSSLLYLAEVEIGNPSTVVYLIVDTASSLTWTQCKPCDLCYQQNSPIYDSQTSTTFRKIPSHHPTCSDRNSFFDSDNDQCIYSLTYGDGSHSFGVGSFDSFKVSEDRVFHDVIFGCSNRSYIEGYENSVVSGIMGLNDSPVSLISQFPNIIKGKYSYCFPPFFESLQDPFYMTFGDIIPTIANLSTINIIRSPKDPSLFYLSLRDVSVADQRLNLSSDSFELRDDGTGGFFIDSGCSISTLNSNAYKQVISSFETYYDSHGLTKLSVGLKGFELCYLYDVNFDDYASMTYHFKEDDFVVSGLYTSYIDIGLGYFCVALLPIEDESSVLGAWHQQDMRLIYDVTNNELHYASELCGGYD